MKLGLRTQHMCQLPQHVCPNPTCVHQLTGHNSLMRECKRWSLRKLVRASQGGKKTLNKMVLWCQTLIRSIAAVPNPFVAGLQQYVSDHLTEDGPTISQQYFQCVALKTSACLPIDSGSRSQHMRGTRALEISNTNPLPNQVANQLATSNFEFIAFLVAN